MNFYRQLTDSVAYFQLSAQLQFLYSSFLPFSIFPSSHMTVEQLESHMNQPS